jgi:hypothetical protein
MGLSLVVMTACSSSGVSLKEPLNKKVFLSSEDDSDCLGHVNWVFQKLSFVELEDLGDESG